MRKHISKSLLATCAVCFATAGYSAEETTNLSVTAIVADTCTVVAGTALAFATIDTSTTADESVPGVITVVCTSTKSGLSIALGSGGNATGGQRRMTDGSSNFLAYNLHDDAAHASAVAIDGEVFNGNITAAVPLVVPVYGQIPAGNFTAGAYSDTITVTLTY